MRSKVLIVDDIPANLRALSMVLEPLSDSVELVQAASGYGALELLMHNTFALVLLDVNMPDMSGYEVAELITKSNMHRNTPIVMVTAQGAETTEVLKAYEAGAVDYLAKPIIPLVVLNKVRQFVALHKSQQNASILKAEREAILDAAGEGVIKISQHGIIDYCNAKACQLLCDEKKEIIGSSVNRWFHIANENDFEAEVRYEQSNPDLYGDGYDDNKLFSIILDGVRKSGMYQKKNISILSNAGSVTPVEITCTLTMTEKPSIILLFQNITHRIEVEKRLEYLANYDSMTGLMNRACFSEALSNEIMKSSKNSSSFALLLLDLDRFKEVNDTLGHDIGDLVLKRVGSRLISCVKYKGFAARLGGDEFAIIIRCSEENCNDAISVSRKLLNEISKPIQSHDRQLLIDTSIGIATCTKGAYDVATLMKSADIALYAAKSSGRNTYRIFLPEMLESHNNVAILEQRLKLALEKKEFIIEYQPIVSMSNYDIVALEALIRWPISEGGKTVTPDIFIPIAEQTDLINDISMFVIEQVMVQMVEWAKKRSGMEYVVSINLSAHQLREGFFVVGLYHLIRKYGIRADRISFEITETAIFDNSSKAFYTLKLLKLFGFGLSLDDFGTGYSSLSHLKITPIDTIKVDRSFVKDIMTCEKNIVIIEAIMFIADKFGLKVIAEGVETKQQIKTLSRVGCEIYQGFFFSCALAPDKIEVLHDFGFKRFFSGQISSIRDVD